MRYVTKPWTFQSLGRFKALDVSQAVAEAISLWPSVSVLLQSHEQGVTFLRGAGEQ
jgi:hypothetical protein